jgi:hypothetical protein
MEMKKGLESTLAKKRHMNVSKTDLGIRNIKLDLYAKLVRMNTFALSPEVSILIE